MLRRKLKMELNIFNCRKHFVDGHAFQCHVTSKPHKRRMNALKIEPYTIEESEVTQQTLDPVQNYQIIFICNYYSRR